MLGNEFGHAVNRGESGIEDMGVLLADGRQGTVEVRRAKVEGDAESAALVEERRRHHEDPAVGQLRDEGPIVGEGTACVEESRGVGVEDGDAGRVQLPDWGRARTARRGSRV
ncbi:hypothetical protein ACWDCC_40310 [Streptomyces sp. NPDC001102]